eukprot:TRINITY_DN147_c0_g3_i1.p1 TRINITY_DN147_c0_g3~~TRINITY_DN147_c0_g3_i1.p1  ORF type:complete len:308 (-),score=89.94 TRINITY_DN147_c0_g3_i1:150-1073(-)
MEGQTAAGLMGTVRSYNGAKGFGFITGQGAFADVMFSRHELPEDAREVRGKFVEGRTVTFDAVIKPDGRAKATAVSIVAAEGLPCSGKVKCFMPQNGFGYIQSHSLPDNDARFKLSDFAGVADGNALKNQLVTFEYTALADGKLRVTRASFQTQKIAEQVKMGGMPMMGGMQMGGMQGFPGMQMGGMQQQFGMMGMQQGVKRGPQDMMMTGFGQAFKMQKSVDVPVTSTGQFMQGTVKSYNQVKGWGLISSPGIPSGGAGQAGDVFFMKSNLSQQEVRDQPIQGRAVAYELVRTNDGKYRAQNITVQ